MSKTQRSYLSVFFAAIALFSLLKSQLLARK